MEVFDTIVSLIGPALLGLGAAKVWMLDPLSKEITRLANAVEKQNGRLDRVEQKQAADHVKIEDLRAKEK